MDNTVDYINLSRNDKTQEKSDRFLKTLLLSLLMMALLYLSMKAVAEAIDKHIRNQDVMLCESALISENPDYLKKCQCYYDGENIECLEGGE